MELLQYTFFQHALIGSLLASIACGLIGTYIVTRRLVFISGGLTHASFGGIGLGLYTGISPILSAALFAVLSAFGVEWLSKRKDMREDSAIAVFWTLGMALGIMFTFLSPGFAPDLSAYLFGNILTITWSDIALLGGLALLLILFFALYLHPIIYVAFDREFARSQGIPVQVFEYVLMMRWNRCENKLAVICGTVSSEMTSTMPTMRRHATMVSAMNIISTYSNICTGIPCERANSRSKAT